MELKVLRFSQEASLTNPRDMKNFLVLGTGTSEEIRIEISAESMQTLVSKIYSSVEDRQDVKETLIVNINSSEDQLSDPPVEEATVFGDSEPNILAVDEDGIESL